MLHQHRSNPQTPLLAIAESQCRCVHVAVVSDAPNPVRWTVFYLLHVVFGYLLLLSRLTSRTLCDLFRGYFFVCDSHGRS